MTYGITISFPAAMKVETYPDPATVSPGRYVFWTFNGGIRPDVTVEFFAVVRLDAERKPLGAVLPTGPNGPFGNLVHSGMQIVGVALNSPPSPTYYRFYYYVLEDGKRLQSPAPAGLNEGVDYIGGIDVPVMPPRGNGNIGEP